MLLRLAYLGVANVFALLRLLSRSDHDKDTEILILRHQIAVLQRQLGDRRVRFQAADRALVAALLRPPPGRAAAASTARAPGYNPALAHLLEGILHGTWLPYRHRERVCRGTSRST